MLTFTVDVFVVHCELATHKTVTHGECQIGAVAEVMVLHSGSSGFDPYCCMYTN